MNTKSKNLSLTKKGEEKKMRALTKIFIGVVLSLFLVVPAFAFPVIDFGTGDANGTLGHGGTITFTGVNQAFGSVPVDDMSVMGALVNGVFDTSGAFNFINNETKLPETAALVNFSFGPSGNFVNVIGGVPALGIPDGTTLLSGTFSSFVTFGTTAIQGSGPDDKSPILLTALGIPLDTPFNFFGFSIDTGVLVVGPDVPPNTFQGVSTDFANSGKVPEPISLILLGSGLAGAGLYRRLRKTKD